MPPDPATSPPLARNIPRLGRRRLAALILVSILLGLGTSIASIFALATLRNPPNTPATVSRTFIRENRAWTVVESRRFGITRTWWLQLTRADMTLPTKKSARVRVGEWLGHPAREVEDPAVLIADLRASSDSVILGRPGGRVLETPAAWGEFATEAPLPAQTAVGCDVGYGWPFIAAWYQIRGRSRGNYVLTDDTRHGHILSGTPAVRGDLNCHIIPLRPVWPGLVGNSAVLTGAWLIALLVPAAARRSLRRARGRCGHCGYDLRATPPGAPCPECGRGA